MENDDRTGHIDILTRVELVLKTSLGEGFSDGQLLCLATLDVDDLPDVLVQYFSFGWYVSE